MYRNKRIVIVMPAYITLADKILINHVPAAYCTQGC
jgi:hypothetical protein